MIMIALVNPVLFVTVSNLYFCQVYKVVGSFNEENFAGTTVGFIFK